MRLPDQVPDRVSTCKARPPGHAFPKHTQPETGWGGAPQGMLQRCCSEGQRACACPWDPCAAASRERTTPCKSLQTPRPSGWTCWQACWGACRSACRLPLPCRRRLQSRWGAGQGPLHIAWHACPVPGMHIVFCGAELCRKELVWVQIWRHAIILTSEAILEGLSKVRGRCTLVGRAQMSADLQEAVHALRAVTPVSRETTAALEALLFLNDGYIKVVPCSSLCCGPSRCTLGHQMVA